MKRIPRFPDRGPDSRSLEAEACEWFTRLDSGTLSANERVDFEKWLTRSTEHQAEFERVRNTWNDLNALNRLALAGTHRGPATQRAPSARRSRFPAFPLRRPLGIVLASVMFMTVGVVICARIYERVPVGTSWSFATRTGEQRTAALPDGSTVLVNTASRLQVTFDAKSRDVQLLQGEAHFAVAHDAARPFFVHAGSGVVRAVGTAFTVRLREQEVDVTVTEGTIELTAAPTDRGRRAQTSADGVAPARVAIVKAGRRATINGGAELVQPLKVEELAHELAWQQGMLSFSGNSLDFVVAEVSRYTPVKIVIVDPTLRNLRIGGYFRIGETDAILEALESSFNVQVERVNDHLVYLTRRPG